jgi:hypothetical protein
VRRKGAITSFDQESLDLDQLTDVALVIFLGLSLLALHDEQIQRIRLCDT